MNNEAFLAGYLRKEAGYWDNLKGGAESLWKGEAASDIYQGAVKPAAQALGTKAADTLTGTTEKQRTQFKNFAKDPKTAMETMAKPYVDKAREEVKGGMKTSVAANSAVTLGTGLLGNIAAGSRHKELMAAVKSGRQQPINKPAAQRAFRLNRPVPGTAGRAR